MRIFFVVLLFFAFMLSGCTNNNLPPQNNTTIIPPPPNNTTTIPPGYEVKDYCQKDSDCVRLNSCCDCGPGVYVNIYNQAPECTGVRCMCAIALSKGVCADNHCKAVPGQIPIEQGNGSGFCGYSTNATCSADSDCVKGGCSGQVCQSKSQAPVITTCIYRDCYDAARYGVRCGCSGDVCAWR